MSDLYTPDSVSDVSTVPEVLAYVRRELDKVRSSFTMVLPNKIEFRTAAPGKVFEGLTVGADGTNWNPGGGKGVYTYYSGAWNKLG